MSQQEEVSRNMTTHLSQMPVPQKKYTKIVSDKEISQITLKNFPKKFKISIFLFKLSHYILLIVSCSQLIVRRFNEYDDILKIEATKVDPIVREKFYSFTGIIYAKYNLEILNFIFFLLIVSNFHRLSLFNFLAKLFFGEFMLIALICWKVTNYIIEMKKEDTSDIPISYMNVIIELALLVFHVVIVVSFLIIYLGFRKSKEAKNIYRVHYLGKKIKRIGRS